jgi:hypothetical protein
MTQSTFDFALFKTLAESLTVDSTCQLAQRYSIDATFTDPFQTVRGRESVAQVYQSMFEHLENPRFTQVRLLTAPVVNDKEVVVGWNFEFAMGPGKPRQSIPGVSLLTLNPQGLIDRHVDYWDASLLFEALPLVGRIVRWLRQRIGHSAKS